MTETTLDCRGMACPNAVLKAKGVMDRGSVEGLSAIVDNPAAKENVSLLASDYPYRFPIHLVEAFG